MAYKVKSEKVAGVYGKVKVDPLLVTDQPENVLPDFVGSVGVEILEPLFKTT